MMIHREIEIYSLPLPSGVTLLNTHKIVLGILRGYTIDFGAWCYLRRSGKQRIKGKSRKVAIESRCPMRTEQVAKLITQLVELSASGQFAPHTLKSRYKDFEKFLFWCDANERSDVLHDISSARRAIPAYVFELRDLTGSVAKVERLIDAKSAQVEKLKLGAPMSFEYKVENAELEALRAGLARGKEEIRKRSLPQ